LNSGRYPPSYRKGRAKVRFYSESHGFRLSISHNGYSRIGKKIKITRSFRVTNNNITINDYVDGVGKHNITAFFHIGENIIAKSNLNIFPNRIMLKYKKETIDFDVSSSATKSNIDLVKGRTDGDPAGLNFPQYGKYLNTTSIIIKSSTDLPFNARYTMRIAK